MKYNIKPVMRTVFHNKDISVVDLVFQALKTCGVRAIAIINPARYPIICIISIDYAKLMNYINLLIEPKIQLCIMMLGSVAEASFLQIAEQAVSQLPIS